MSEANDSSALDRLRTRIASPTTDRALDRLGATEAERSGLDLATVERGLLPHLEEIRERFARAPFKCRLLGCFRVADGGKAQLRWGALPPEVEAARPTLHRALLLRRRTSFDLEEAPSGERWTVGVLPFAAFAFVLLRVEPTTEEPYGMTTDFLDVAAILLASTLSSVCWGNGSVAAFTAEESAFRAMLPMLLPTHSGKYVAVYGERVVDEDDDEVELARRMLKAHRNEFVLIRRVSSEQPPVLHFDSPQRKA